ANYDDVLVTLLGDIATTYVHIRTLEQRMEFVRQNVDEQRKIVEIIERIYEAGGDPRKGYPPKRLYDVYQVKSVLAQTESQLPQLQFDRREAENRLCILLGMPPANLQGVLGAGPIPAAPAQVVVGIPADLLRRRPDIRRAERQAAAQAEQIGIAEADFYPMLTIQGTLGYQSPEFAQLFTSGAFNGTVGPSFHWNILNYGRIRNNVRLQEAKFQEMLTNYQHTVLLANAEVENGLARFLQAQERARWLDASADYAEKAVGEIRTFAEVGWKGFDANQLAVITQTKVHQQDLQAQAHGEIAQGLIQVYRALGGGWETSTFLGDSLSASPPPATPGATEELPSPPAEELPSPPADVP
ncbi:MAG: TolC family protein, partial [Pirellulaceae bacterium]|nr:TolC family protein [Pirellulaceae bacterium]